MVDPFFQKAQAAQTTNSSVGTSQPAVSPGTSAAIQQEIQTLLQQQQTLQTQYNQYAAYLQNPQITPEQKQQVQQYLQQLSLQYQQIATRLQQLGYSPAQHVNKPVTVKPASGSKVSMKGLLLGCGVLFILLVGGVSGMFYYLINNPGQLASLGLDIETTRSLLNTFSLIFFALVVFSGMAMLVVNGYRLVSVKNTSKTKYAFGLFFGFLIFVFGLGAGYQVLTMIKSITVSDSVDNTKLVLPYIQLKSGLTPLSSDPKLILLAPSTMAFKLNTNYFNAQILPTLGQASFDSLVLDCGNKQTLSMNMSNAEFEGTCNYFEKGAYNLVLKVAYTNTPTGEKFTKDIPAGTLDFVSQISVSPINGQLTFNDSHTEMSVGKVPSKVKFDASRVFSDLGLADYNVVWDINGDGTMDQQNVSSFTTSYKEAKLYTVAVRFPDVNDYVYTFPLRVEQSDVPVCEILAKDIGSNSYQFTTNFLTQGNVEEYQYQILSQGKSLYTMKSKSSSFQYTLPSSGIYSVKAVFVTDDGKQGSCESDDISVGAASYALSYSVQYKNATQTSFSDFDKSGPNTFVNDTITIGELPTVIQFSLDSVQPNEPGLTKQLLFDGKPVVSSNNTFEVKVDTSTPHVATFVVQNPSSGAKTEKKIQIVVKRDAVMGKFLIKPDIVGADPFVVTFDASVLTLNDANDEIVYFTWDFGDGEIKKNLSQSVLQHTYVYNSTTDSGVYHPKVTVVTKKGVTATIESEYPITVKKKTATLSISIDSHPNQVARINDRVQYSLELNGVPKTISWDFGNGKTLQCSNRECVSSSSIYSTPGKYTIKAKVTYEDKPEIEGTIALKVQ